MKNQQLSHDYATAIFNLALENWLLVLKRVQDSLQRDAALLAKLTDTTQTFQDRQKLLNPLIPTDSSTQIQNFLYTLLKEGQIELLGDVLADLERMLQGGPQVQIAYVTTAYMLAEEEKDKFRQKLRAKHGDNVEFVFNVDKSIIGGAVVQIGDKLIDGTVSTRFEAMKNLLGAVA